MAEQNTLTFQLKRMGVILLSMSPLTIGIGLLQNAIDHSTLNEVLQIFLIASCYILVIMFLPFGHWVADKFVGPIKRESQPDDK